MHFLGLLVCLLLMASIRALGSWTGVDREQPTLVMATGFVLLTAFVAGRTSHRFHLPRVTGYLLLGTLIGPGVLNLITDRMSEGLLFINGLTVSLIALSAGGELKLEWLASRIKQILTISLVGAAVVFVFIFAMVFLLKSWLPFPKQNPLIFDITIAAFIGLFAIANSPMVVIALITETESRGTLAQTILGVTVVRDVLVIILFSVFLTVADILLGGQTLSVGGIAAMMGREVGGSIGIGFLLGGGLALCAQYLRREMPLVVMGFCFFMAHLGAALDVDPLLMGLAAGFFVENIARQGGPELIAGIERCSLPLYCLFFGLAGVSLDIHALAALWPVALVLAAVRCIGLWAGTHLGAQLSSCEPRVASMGWLGFIANAGVLLAMASIVARTFPEWGVPIQALAIALIGINLLLGPIGFRYALVASGEAQEA